jgi:hypothetical protein
VKSGAKVCVVCVRGAPLLLYRDGLVGLGGIFSEYTLAPPASVLSELPRARWGKVAGGGRSRAPGAPAHGLGRPSLLRTVGCSLVLGFGVDVGWPWFGPRLGPFPCFV